jgi:thioredoxin reductase (NADPH)
MGHFDVIVIGSGVTGLVATRGLLQTKRGLSVANIEAESFGGLVMNVNELDGDIHGSGLEYTAGMMLEVTDLGAAALSEWVTEIAQEAAGWAITTDQDRHHARVVIIASGARPKKLGIPGEAEFEYKGVSRCADCDGPMFTGKDVVVAGGGDSALQEARVLAKFCNHVYVLSREEKFVGRQHLIDALAGCSNVTVRHKAEARAILGGTVVEKVRVKDLAANADSEIACSGFFGFIGLQPASDFVPANLRRDSLGHLVTDTSLKAAENLFAAGAVRSGYSGLLADAVAEGLAAANQAAKALGA